MQTLSEIRRLLEQAELAPRQRWGQCFLIDGNLMGKLLELAAPPAGATVLEVGAGTGSLTEELLARGAAVVAVEVDPGLCRVLRTRLGDREGFALIEADALAGKRGLSPAVSKALPATAHLVANLPYGIATPLVAECLVSSWRAQAGEAGCCRFDRLTFTVQREVADRLSASPGSKDYGPISVLVALLGRVRLGSAVPASAFWPAPRVASRMVRIDFDPAAAGELKNLQTLRALLAAAFGQRRKQIGSVLRRKAVGTDAEALADALERAGIDTSLRAEAIAPAQYLSAANALG
jgi:16S rRNA (adenine1518-N6/adenine1519-N6)-dimethyltransferase